MSCKAKPKIASLFKATSPDKVRHAKVLSLHSQISKSIIFKQKPLIYKVFFMMCWLTEVCFVRKKYR